MAYGTYKINPRNVSVEKADLRRLIDFVIAKTIETRDLEKRELDLSDQTEEQKNSTLATLDDGYKIAVFVYGAEGEELIVRDSAIIDAPEFPEQLTRITIDSFIPFRNRTNGLAPRNGLRIDLDFSSSQILDWQSNVSAPTPNGSQIVIEGNDENWRAAAIGYLQKLFKSRKNHRGFLHAAHTYDLYLWLFFIPIFFLGAAYFDERMGMTLSNVSSPLRIAIYVYAFFLYINLYRLILGYIRWTFQTIELKDVRSTQQKHRRFWAFLATVVLIPFLISFFTGR